MHLKRLEVSGFKTFADRTALEFHPGITAIVGPNGSGKSNLLEAVRWVLGEHNARTLRGLKMEDLVFAGSAGRRAHGLASVTLTLDNSGGALPLDFSEVGVARRVTRGGEGECFLNGVPCRLRDVQLLFLGTGLGGRSYALIGQGEVDAVLNASPDQRRLLLEEAAGLARHRRRRAESLRRLEHAAAHLLRLHDLLDELRAQHDRLAAQAEAARLHRAYSTELRSLELALVAEEGRRAASAVDRYAGQVAAAGGRVVEAQAHADAARAEAEDGRRRTESLAREWESEQRRLVEVLQAGAAAAAAVEGTEARLAGHRREQERIQGQAAALGVEIDRICADLAVIGAQRQEAARTAQASREEFEAGAAELDAADPGHAAPAATAAALEAERMRLFAERQALAEEAAGRIRALDADRDALAEEARAAEGSRHRLQARLEALEESGYARGSEEGYEDGARAVLRAQSQDPAGLAGIAGVFTDLITVDDAYRSAVEAALGRRIHCVLAATLADVRAALDHLRADGRAPAVFLPLEHLGVSDRPGSASGPVPQVAGVVGDASALVRPTPAAASAAQVFLTGTLVVRDLDAGLRCRAAGFVGQVVTLAGEVLGSDGTMTFPGPNEGAGALMARRAAMDAARRELAEVTVRLDALRQRQALLAHEIDTARAELAQAEGHWSRREREIGDAAAALRIRLAEAQAAALSLLTREQDFSGMRDALLVRRSRLLGDGAVLAAEAHLLERDREEARVERRRLAEAEREAAGRLATLEEERRAAGASLADAAGRIDHLQQEVRAAEAALHRLEVRAAQAETEWAALRTRVEEEFRVEWEQAATVTLPGAREEARKRLDELRTRIAELGLVNLLAIEEQETLAARRETLARQVADIEGAREILMRLVGHLDGVLRVRFRETFDAVSEEFNRLFVRLFEGGTARLELLQPEEAGPEHSADPGLEVVVRLPGKPARPLAALSGGERVLVALALLFAMLRVHPSPFCIFDEVEAALDDANTRRFTTLLSELAERTQIMIITHNKGTMEAADVLYGVTMQEPGVSSVLSVRLAERPARPAPRPVPEAVGAETAAR